MSLSADEFLDLVEQSGLVSAKDVASWRSGTARDSVDLKSLVDQLVKAGGITAYQAKHLTAGRSNGFFVSKYKILEPIGEGGMGRVFRAEDTELRRFVALKVLPLWASEDRRKVARFQREAWAAARLLHENVVRIYDVGQHRFVHYLAMELVDGINLRKMIEQRGRLSVPETVPIILQVADGLQHAFQRGVTHRDIKPSNILVNADGKAKILDMGIARFQRGDATPSDSIVTDTGEVMGTVDYMAPEQAADTRTADVRSDIYALGCTLYHCLAGQIPFPASSLPDKLQRHKHSLPLALQNEVPDVPQRLATLIERMMAKSPMNRPQTPADVVADLSAHIISSDPCRIPAPLRYDAATTNAEPRLNDGDVPISSRYCARDTLAGRYEIISLIGKGGMGEVYHANDTQLSREVAVKTLLDYKRLDSTALKRFEREAKSLAALSHPNVLAVFDIGWHDDIPFVVMELVRGEALSSVARRERLPWTRVLETACEITSGLAAAHERGIIHRDVKPDNVIVLSDQRIKIIDFGLARLQPERLLDEDPMLSSTTKPGAMIGTVPYMSPEQASGKTLTTASDMFSLGILLYELASREHPFRSASMLGTMHAIVHEEPILPSRFAPEIPGRLETIIMQLLEKDHRLRLSADEAQQRLSEIGSVEKTVQRVAEKEGLDQGRAPCIGREKELARLNLSLESARQGQGRLLCVIGEAGIGKTTLIERFLYQTQSSSEPCIVARGSCSERLAGSDGYLPFLEALGDLLTSDSRQRNAELMRLTAPSWYIQVLTSQTGVSTDSQLVDVRGASQERMKREFVAFLDALGRTAPVVIFLDDLHWVDISTADLLCYLARKSPASRLLLLCSYRPTELARSENAFVQAKLDLQARGVCEELGLGFLSQENVAEYLNLEFRRHRFPPELPEVIHARTEGNALFLVDLVRYLRESKILAQDGETWVLDRPLSAIEQQMPDSVKAMVQKITEQLDDADRQLLVAASVQGAEFHAAVLAKTAGIDECDAEDRLELLSRTHGLIRSVGEEELPDATLTLRYTFVHVLYQNAFYGTLTPARRARLSAKVAQALCDYHASHLEEVALELAILYEAARDFTSASDCFLRAAEHAAELSANHEAISLAWRAIENARRLTRKARHHRTIVAAFHIARVCQTLGKFDDAVTAYDLVERTAIAAGESPARIEAICGKASTFFLNKQVDRTRNLGLQALQLAQDNHLEIGQAQAESVLASERLCCGDFEQAEHLYDRAIPVLKARGSLTHAMDAANFRTLFYAWRLEYGKFHAGREWWMAQARKLGVSPTPMYFFTAMALGNQGHLSDALHAANEGRRLAELNDDTYHICRLPNVIGWLKREVGDFEAAVVLDDESSKLGRELGYEEAEANARVNLAHDFIVLGELDRAFEQLVEAESLFERDVWFRWRYNIRLKAELAVYWMARGDLSLAETYAQTSLQMARKSMARKHIAWGHKLLADVMVGQDRIVQARHELNQSLQLLDQYACPTVDWRICAAAADLARLTKDSQMETIYRQRMNRVLNSLTESLTDDNVRTQFLESESVRKAMTAE